MADGPQDTRADGPRRREAGRRGRRPCRGSGREPDRRQGEGKARLGRWEEDLPVRHHREGRLGPSEGNGRRAQEAQGADSADTEARRAWDDGALRRVPRVPLAAAQRLQTRERDALEVPVGERRVPHQQHRGLLEQLEEVDKGYAHVRQPKALAELHQRVRLPPQ